MTMRKAGDRGPATAPGSPGAGRWLAGLWGRGGPEGRAGAPRRSGPEPEGRAAPGPGPQVPAVVLTCDRYHPFTAHMIVRYQALWPSHPFVFHVPYQERPLAGAGIESRRTPGSIRGTVLALLDAFDEDAWVYWCSDDRYPVQLVQPAVARIAAAVAADAVPDVDGILFCRCRRLLRPEYLAPERRAGPGGVVLMRRKDYSQIWIHQFLRARVLRHLFLRFPETVPEAKVLDPLKHQVELPADHRLYVVETNLAVFGESTIRGRVTRNCASSLRENGLGVPPRFEESDAEELMGTIDAGPERAPGRPGPAWLPGWARALTGSRTRSRSG